MSLDPKNLKPIIIEEISSIITERLGTLLKLADDLAKLGDDAGSKAAKQLADDFSSSGSRTAVSKLSKSKSTVEKELGQRYNKLTRQ